MNRDSIISIVAMMVIVTGIAAIIFLALNPPQTTALPPTSGVQEIPSPAINIALPTQIVLPTVVLPTVALPIPESAQTVTAESTPVPTAGQNDEAALRSALATTIAERQAGEPTTTEPVVLMTPQPLPDVPLPNGATLYELRPTSPDLVGWARQDNDNGNEFGDFNIFAGTYQGQRHVGAVQFDLSAIPIGAPIVHADITFTGINDQWLGSDGNWTISVLEPWMDTNWITRSFHWLTRAESESAALAPSLSAADLAVGKANTVLIPSQMIPLLQDRLFTGKVSFRITGPTGDADNLFGWSSGARGPAPVLRIVAGEAPSVPPPTPTPNYVIVTPVDVVALAAERLTATAQAPQQVADTNAGTPTPTHTPLPPNWVTPIIVVPTAIPENQATAVWLVEVAQAQAVVYGTPTATPPNVWTATPTPTATATPLFLREDQLTPTPTMTATPGAIPDFLRGKIFFYSNRTGSNRLMFMNPDGSDVSLWQGDDWVYRTAKERETQSRDGSRWVAVQREQVTIDQIFVLSSDGRQQLTHFNDVSYDPVWSPVEDRILFVSPQSGNDEIYSVWFNGDDLKQLTNNEWQWDKHPSWSPDGSEIVFFSNRTGQSKLYIMSADGSNVRQVSFGEGDDLYPVWIK